MTDNRLLTIAATAGGGKRSFAGILLCLQLIAVIAAVIAANLAPPASGRMLVLPLMPARPLDITRDVIAGGARLVSRGPFAGSIIVEADRDQLLSALSGSGAVVLGTSGGGCA